MNSTKCVSCAKTAYPVEQVKVDELVFHAACFKCAHCNSKLSLGKYAAISGKYYCKPHFKQLFALKGNYSGGFGADNSSTPVVSPSIATPSSTERSHEQVSQIKFMWDSKANQNGSNSNHGSSADLSSKHQKNVSDKITSSIENLLKASEKHSETQNAPAANKLASDKFSKFGPAAGGASNKCAECSKTAYPVEQIRVDDVVFHKACFKCAHCNNKLTLGKYAALEGKYFCKPHFKQLFALKGNYNEGFGSRPHKEKWLHKDQETAETPQPVQQEVAKAEDLVESAATEQTIAV